MAEKGIKAIKAGKLIDGTGAAPVENATVLIEDGKIKAVGQNIDIPKEAQVIDATGKTVMPGMIDAHVHLEGTRVTDLFQEEITRPRELRLIKAIDDAKTFLQTGFTTVKCCGGINGVYLKQAAQEGILSGVPRITAAAYMLQNVLGNPYPFLSEEYLDPRTSKLRGYLGGPILYCDGVDECIKATRYTLSHGADFIKIWPRRGAMFNQDELKAIVQTAGQVGKYVSIHCENAQDTQATISCGAKTAEHVAGLDDATVEMGIKAGVIFVSTLLVIHSCILYGVESGKFPNLDREKMFFNLMCQSYKKIRKAGGVLALGTDNGGESLVEHLGTSAVEIELLVENCDFTPMEAIVVATKNSAMACFMGDITGTIEPGKFADILVIDGDPLANIKILQDREKIKMVILEGKVEVER